MHVTFNSVRFCSSLLAVAVACVSLPAQTQTQTQPVRMVAVGKSPLALAVPITSRLSWRTCFPKAVRTKVTQLEALG